MTAPRIGSALKNLTSTPGATPSGIQGMDSSEMQLASTCSKNIAFSVFLISARATGATTLRDSYARDCRNCDKAHVVIRLPRDSAMTPASARTIGMGMNYAGVHLGLWARERGSLSKRAQTTAREAWPTAAQGMPLIPPKSSHLNELIRLTKPSGS